MKLAHRKALLVSVLTLASLACTTLQVINTSGYELRVQVSMPDGEGPVTKVIAPKGELEFISETGGTFEVVVMPSETMIAELRNEAHALGAQLFASGNTLIQEEISTLIQNMSSIHDLADSLMRQYDRCSIAIATDEIGEVIVDWTGNTLTYPTGDCTP